MITARYLVESLCWAMAGCIAGPALGALLRPVVRKRRQHDV